MPTLYPAIYNCIKAIQRLTLEIRSNHEFHNDITSVSIPHNDIENMKAFPHVNLSWGAETYLTANDNARVFEQEDKVVDVYFDIYFKDEANLNLRRSLFVADFERQFDKGRNYLLPDETGAQTCFNSQWVSNQMHGTKQSNVYMLEMVLRVWYNTARGNPYQLV